MKKLMILGGSINQVPLIECANQQGYYTIVCDYNPNNPGTKIADKYFQQDYMSVQEILEIAKNEMIDGIISNSEAAVFSVSYVAEKLHLVGNTTESAQTLLNKSKFRQLQKKVGVFSPAFFETEDIDDAVKYIESIDDSVIIKPSECSGSRGTRRIDKNEADSRFIINAVNICKSFSRNSRITIEQYVKMPSMSVYDAEIFVINGEVLWDGFYLSERSIDNPFIPRRVVLPLVIPNSQKDLIKHTVERLLEESNSIYGEFNVETYFTENNEVFVVEINPRQGGNNIPQIVKEHCGIDYTKLLVTTAVNDFDYYDSIKNLSRDNNYLSEVVIFSSNEGILQGIHIDNCVKEYVLWTKYEKQIGEYVNKKTCAGDAVAWCALKFKTYEEQCRITANIERNIYPIVQRGN